VSTVSAANKEAETVDTVKDVVLALHTRLKPCEGRVLQEALQSVLNQKYKLH